MVKKFSIEGIQSKITSDKVLTSEEEARERFWAPTDQPKPKNDLKNDNDSINNNAVVHLDVSSVVPDPNQPRKHFDKNSLDDLTNSIRERGVETPIIVRAISEGKFRIIAGERRWRCSVTLGLKTIPAIIRDLNDAEAYMLALTENIQRENLHYLDESEAFKKMIDKGYVKDQKELAERLGKSRGYISEKFKVLTLPQAVKDLIYRSDAITFSHAVLLAQVSNSEGSFDLASKIVNGEMSVRKLEAHIAVGDYDTSKVPRHKSSFQPVQIIPVSNGYNLTVKFRQDRPDDILKIINVLEQKVEELKNNINNSGDIGSSHV